MNWEKIRPSQYITNPVEIIYARNIVDSPEYDRLYENQNNLDHKVWKDFDEKYKIGFEFKEDITDIDLNKEVIALWFFRERSDRGSTPHLDIKEKLLPYEPNTIVLTACKQIKVQESKRKYIRRQLIQLDIIKAEFDKIIERVKNNPKVKKNDSRPKIFR